MDLFSLNIKIKFKGNYKKTDLVDFSNQMFTPKNRTLVLYFSPDFALSKELFKKVYGASPEYLENLFSDTAYRQLYNKRKKTKKKLFTFMEIIKKMSGNAPYNPSENDLLKFNKSVTYVTKNIQHNIDFIMKLLFVKNKKIYPAIKSSPPNATVFSIHQHNWPRKMRSKNIVITDVARSPTIPSFTTACYII